MSVLARGFGYHQAYNLAAYSYSSTRKDDYWIFVVFTILAMSGLDVLVLLSYLQISLPTVLAIPFHFG